MLVPHLRQFVHNKEGSAIKLQDLLQSNSWIMPWLKIT